MRDESTDSASFKRESKQLKRLERVVDVVYAILIWRAFEVLPRPTKEELSWEEIGSFLSANTSGLLLSFIGIVVVIIFWLKSNSLLGNLRSTNTFHTTLTLLQVFFVLMFLLSLRYTVELGGSTGTRLFESVTVLLAGLTGGWSWSYAIKNNRLVSPEVTQQYARGLRDQALAEPVTAAITIPFAFVGALFWELSWWIYPLIVWFSRHRNSRLKALQSENRRTPVSLAAFERGKVLFTLLLNIANRGHCSRRGSSAVNFETEIRLPKRARIR